MCAFDPNNHLRNLKGQQYLDVKWRLLWVNDDAETKGLRFSLTTDLVNYDPERKEYTFKALLEIMDENGAVVKRTTGWGTETEKDFPAGPCEKAETKAIGRALAAAGYGTQFAVELEEGDRLADSPVTPAKPAARPATSQDKQGDRGDGTALLRSQVAAALAADKEAASKLPKAADDMTQDELDKTLSWLRNRARRQS